MSFTAKVIKSKAANRNTAAKVQPKTQKKKSEGLEGKTNGLTGLIQSKENENSLSQVISKAKIQRKVSIGASNDSYEKEADKVADHVVQNLSGPKVESNASTDIVSAKKVQSRKSEPAQKVQSKTRTPVISKKNSQEIEKKEDEVQAKFLENTSVLSFDTTDNSNPASGFIQAKADVQRSGEGESTASSSFENSLDGSKGGGSPLPDNTRSEMESGIGADFSGVRVHTDSNAADMSSSINAKAFTHGNDVYFNQGQYNPESTEGKHLIAHELTHTVQQGAAVQTKSMDAPKIVQTKKKIQRGWLGDAWDSVSSAVSSAVDYVADGLDAALNWVKDQFGDFVSGIPGYRLLTVVLGQDPVTGQAVARNGRNFIEAGLDIIPFGNDYKAKLEQEGKLEEAATWLDAEMAQVDVSLSGILSSLSSFWSSLSLTDLGNPTGVLNRAANIVRNPISQIVRFATRVATKLLEIVKNAVLGALVNFIKDHTRGYPLLQVILGKDPITEEVVERNGMNLIRGFMLLSADGEEQLRQMEESGSLQKAADWIDGAVARLDLSWESIKNMFTRAWDLVSITSLMDPIGTFRELADIFGGPALRIVNFVVEVAIQILKFIKDALLRRLKEFAKTIPGYKLLTVILGKDPFTEEPVERNAENIIAGFFNLIPGGDEKFAQMKESGAIARATAWIEGAIARLDLTWEFIKNLFITAWNSFSLADLSAPLEAFQRIMNLFAQPLFRLIRFVVEVLMKIIEIILTIMGFPFDLVTNIINKARQAINDIKRDPIGFLKNILKAIKQGFSQFFDNILTHLLNGVTGWLFGQLGEAGITPPPDFSLRSILGLVFQILGITMDKIWEKLANRIGQEKVDRIRGMIDRLEGIWTFIKDVQERGMAAIWEYIQEKISNLWDMVIDGIKNWIMTRIISAVVTKLLSMLDPTGIMAVINSVIAIYKAIESFIQYIREMLEIVNSFVEGVAEIAAGNTKRAADFLERSMAQALPIAIGFLANQVGLGGLGRRIGEMIGRVQEKVDEGLDWLIDKVVSAGTSFLNMARSGVQAVREWWRGRQPFRLANGENHDLYFEEQGGRLKPMVASENPGPAINRVTEAERSDDPEVRSAATVARREITAAESTPRDQSFNATPLKNAMQDLMDKATDFGGPVRADGVDVQPQVAHETMSLSLGSESNTVGRRMVTNYLSKNHPQGSGPLGSAQRQIFTKLPTLGTVDRELDAAGNEVARDANQLYIKGHLLNDNIGGPGTENNLFPITQRANQVHESSIENDAKRMVNDNGLLIYYSVEVQDINHLPKETLQSKEYWPVNAKFVAQLATYKRVEDRLEIDNANKKQSIISSTYNRPAIAEQEGTQGGTSINDSTGSQMEGHESVVALRSSAASVKTVAELRVQIQGILDTLMRRISSLRSDASGDYDSTAAAVAAARVTTRLTEERDAAIANKTREEANLVPLREAYEENPTATNRDRMESKERNIASIQRTIDDRNTALGERQTTYNTNKSSYDSRLQGYRDDANAKQAVYDDFTARLASAPTSDSDTNRQALLGIKSALNNAT